MAVYAFGSNGSGQLGIGHREDVSSPSLCEIMPDPQESAGMPVKIAAGGNHTLILYSSGQVHLAGSAKSHPVKQATGNNGIFSRVILGPNLLGQAKIMFCCTTWEASIMANFETGSMILSIGSGERGELGRGAGLTTALYPCAYFPIRRVPAGTAYDDMASVIPSTSIMDLASGVYHTVIVFANGEVYGWGNGRKGQLGEPAGIIWNPRKIEGLDFQVTRAACGREFTFLAGDPQTGRYAVLGTDKWQLKSHAPTSILGWKDICASWGSIFILDHSSKITSWGRDDHGQLAPEGLPPIEKIAVGSEHVLALTKDGELLAWGWGEHGNCGPEIDEDGDVKHGWSKIDTSSIKKPVAGIGAGCATSWLWTESN
jgi:protein ATS1